MHNFSEVSICHWLNVLYNNMRLSFQIFEIFISRIESHSAVVGTFGTFAGEVQTGQVNVSIEIVSVAMTGYREHGACVFLIMN